MALQDLRAGTRNEEGIARAMEKLKAQFGERFQTGEAIRRKRR